MTALDEIQPHLQLNEHLLWAGGPDPGKLLSATDAFVVPFSLVWATLAVHWEVTVIHDNAPIIFKLWGIPFVLFGLFLAVGRFAAKRRQRRRTTYAITDQRAIVLTGSRVIDTPVKGRPVTVKWSRNRSHASVMIGGAMGSWSGTAMRMNAGVTLAPQRTYWGVLGFFDVADPGAMLQALDQART